MLKKTLPATLKYLTTSFNALLGSGSFPNIWKKAALLPLSKINIPKSPSDTRPIAQLPEISKILERLVHRQFIEYLEKERLLNQRQAGFRRGHSTQTALLGVTDDIREATDRRMVTILIFFDFSKAFDTIPHDLLLKKLRRINCSDRVINWFYNYLRNRVQAVRDDDGNLSDWIEIQLGVPQGSVLGPLLFLIYINDLPQHLRYSKHMIFADDTQIYLHCRPSDIAAGLARIQQDVNAIVGWARTNCLKLNPDKTKAMILGSLQYTKDRNVQSVNKVDLLGTSIPYSSEVLSLGYWITLTLDWDKHVRHISRKVHGLLRSLRFHRHALSKNLRKNLVESLIFSRFDYACAVYHDLDVTRNTKMQRLLNACVRFVFGNIPRRAHVTPYRLQLDWLSASRRREYFIGNLAYASIAHSNPSYLIGRFRRLNHDVIVRRSQRLAPQSFVYAAPRTEAWRKSFTITASSLLNSLTPPEFNPANIGSFKRNLFQLLLNRDKADWTERMRIENIIV